MRHGWNQEGILEGTEKDFKDYAGILTRPPKDLTKTVGKNNLYFVQKTVKQFEQKELAKQFVSKSVDKVICGDLIVIIVTQDQRDHGKNEGSMADDCGWAGLSTKGHCPVFPL